jgi:3-phosphoglycerate kinase
VVCLLLSDEMSDSDQSELLLRASGSVAGRLLPVFLAESPRVVIPSGVLRPCKVMDIVDSPESITERVVSRCAQWQVGVLAAYSLNLASQVAMLSEGQSKVRSSIGSLERLVILPNFEVPRHESLLLLGDLPTSLAGKSVLVRLDLDMAGDVREGRHHFKIRRAAKTVSELLERGATVRILASQGISAVAAYEQSAVHALHGHARWLAEEVDAAGAYEVLNSYDAKGTATLQFLPNLADGCPEELLLAATQAKRPSPDLVDDLCRNSRLVRMLAGTYDYFVLDDFRSAIHALPSNVGVAEGVLSVAGRGLESDLATLERLLDECIRVGRESAGLRVCVAGSSRPTDITVVDRLLSTRLFDLILVGPIIALMLKAATGDDLPPHLWTELERQAAQNGASLMNLIDGVADRLMQENRERLILPVDYYIDRAGAVDTMAHDGVSLLSRTDVISGIGPLSSALFGEYLSAAALTFHFGMLGRATGVSRESTARVIRSYCEAACPSFMAGDHILNIAHQENLEHLLQGQITGANTTNNYVNGGKLPGLSKLIRRERNSNVV